MDKNFALELVRVTEAAAMASARLMGRGDEKAADEAAVCAMRLTLNTLDFDGTVVIGEGERDEAPMLYIGEKVGKGKPYPPIDIALDPLEGTTICARGDTNSLSCIAIAGKGSFLHAPDTYMQKIAVGPGLKEAIDIRESATKNLNRIAELKKCYIQDLTVVILDRPRHESLMEEVRRAGARIMLIRDGDVSAAVSTCRPRSGIDVLMGIGGAPEGVLAAAALRCMGGYMEGILKPRNPQEIERAQKMGISDIHRVWTIDELAKGHVMFCATGVTDGTLLNGVRFLPGGAVTHSIVMRSETGTIREITARHVFDKKPDYE
ncbi:MAG: fructose-bisphosphatase, class II [Deltaproteobacteria bacterium GWA2_38_16]|nr:MAG: fructose-bisphosphatase, class II [Deltaproteobacteria bacterium GWA2_38_16]OGQ03240.1 MAG: fructose-bisphosphatase, class II [Deltaproteobacteria bacterium RIFCSPHIGHO2_02_FULL_38_15]OGQ58758.1 MAG: fructose-bisphosphatase, class II [Deltaproteobacteria bacterium RIFCSPLOWO2_12_FULL_38_8]HBQ21837.1 class II fructose-bisphosphatase [Deltaproteobacteria bacterium]